MAEPMVYDVILRDKDKPDVKLEWPLGGEESVCWYRIGQALEEFDWDGMGIKTPVLEELTYDFDTDLMSVENVEKAMKVLFDNCKYNVQWDIEKQTVGKAYRMRLLGFEDMPRGLFMNKMFCIRNLIRDAQSFEAFEALLEGGVPFNIAAYFGAGLEKSTRFGGVTVCYIKDYAGFIDYRTKHFAHAIRSMANNSYCEQKSLPWGEGWGYNYLAGDGKGDDGRYLPLPQEITDSLHYYTEGDHLPEGWTPNNELYDLDEDRLTTLMRLICQDENIIIKFKKDS